MQIGNVRFHLRHTGNPRYRLGFKRLGVWNDTWGWNLTLGRWVLVARRPSKHASKHFFDLGFGRSMLKSSKKIWK